MTFTQITIETVNWASNNPIKVGGLLLAIIAIMKGWVLWALTASGKWCGRFIFPHKIISDDDTLKAILSYLKKNAKSYGVSDEDTIGFIKKVTPESGVTFRKYLFGIQLRFSFRFFMLGRCPIFLTPTILSSDDSRQYSTLVYPRWMLDWKKFLTAVADFRDAKMANDGEAKRFTVITYGAEGKSYDSNGSTSVKGFEEEDDIVILNDIDVKLQEMEHIPALKKMSITPQMQRVLNDFEYWAKHEAWYRARSIPWKRGYLLYGDPGVGKSSFIRALAEFYDFPLTVFDLASMTTAEFQQAWNEARNQGNRFVVFEDIDNVFHGRENVSDKDNGVSFAALLNVLDGINKEEGLVLFLTSNHVEHIDPALGAPTGDGDRTTRPGRIDMAVEFGRLPPDGYYKIASRILKDDLLAKKACVDFDGFSATQFQEACLQMAIKSLWGDFPSNDNGKVA